MKKKKKEIFFSIFALVLFIRISIYGIIQVLSQKYQVCKFERVPYEI